MSGSNTLAAAAPLSPTAIGQPILDTVSSSAGDFYRITLVGRSSLNLSLNGLSGNADLQLLNSSGDPIQQSVNQGSLAESINNALLPAGTYYIKVSLGAGSLSVNYRLSYQAQNTPYTSITWRNYASKQDFVWQVSSDGTLVSSAPISGTADPDLNWQIQATGDFNGDGQQDLVWRNQASGQNVVWFMDGSNYIGSTFLTDVGDQNWQIQGAGDFNGDGQTDLVWRNRASGQNLVWFMNGTTFSSFVFLDPVADTNWRLQGAGDFNGDRKTDLVWRNYATGDNLVWFMNGTTLMSSGFLTPERNLNWQIQGVGDFTGDGKPELFWRNMGTGNNGFWKLNGLSLDSFVSISPLPDLNWRAVAPLTGFSTPTPIDVAGNTPGSAFNIGTLSGSGGYSDTVSSADEDYYQFFLNRPSRVSLSVSGAGVNLTLSGNGVPPGGVLSGSGSYSVRVFSTDGGTHPYTLNVNAIPVPNVPTSLNLTAASDSGVSQTDRVTNVRTPLITGLAEANTKVQIFNGGTQIGEVISNASTGAWQFSPTLTEGNNTLTARAVSAAGDSSTDSAALAIVFDSAAPLLAISAPSPSNSLTNQSRLTGTVNGTGSGAATLKYRFDNLADVSVGLGTNGAFDQLFNLTGLHSGTHTLTVTGTDIAGNITTSQFSVGIPFPSAPTLLQVDAASDSGVSSSDGITNDSTPTIVGKAEANATVKLFNGSVLLGQVVADATGNWQFTTAQLVDGSYTLTARAFNSLGDSSVASAALTIVIDTQAPAAPIIEKVNGRNIDDPVYYKQLFPLLEGRAEANSKVEVFVDGTYENRIDASNGLWSTALRSIIDGVYTLTATATDLAGNISAVSTPKLLRNDAAAPILTFTNPPNQAPLTLGNRLTGSASDNRSGVEVVSYKFDPVVSLPFDASSFIPLSFDATGLFDQAIDFSGITNGTHSLWFFVADHAGLTRTYNFSVMVVADQTPPLLSVGLLQDTSIGGTNTDRITANPTLQGTVTDANQITALRAGFENHPTTLTDVPASLWQSTGGTFSLNRTQLEAIYASALPDGTHTLRLQAQDEFGNLADTSFTFTLDTTPPIAPSLQWMTAMVNGQVQNSIRGQAEANAVVKVSNNGKFLGQAIAGSDGTWNLSANGFLTGTQLFTATAIDQAGNESLVSPTLKLVDAVVAAIAPTNLSLAIASDSGMVGDSRTQVKAPTIVGKSESRAQIRIFVDGLVSGSTVASVSGDWSVTLSTPLNEGVRVVTATAKNLQGDFSVFSLPLNLTIDSVPPTVTLSQTPQTVASWTRLVGSIANEDSVVSLSYQIDGSTLRPVTVGADGNFNQTFDLTNLTLNAQSPHTLTLTATDAAGNTTTQSFTVNVVTAGTNPETVLPVLGASLLRDTAAKGTTNTDQVTSDPTVVATIASPNTITTVEAQIVGVGSGFTALMLRPDALGQITLDRTVLEALNGGTLPDGGYTVNLRVTDQFGNLSSVVSVPLTLQTQIPSLSLTDLPDGISWDLDQMLTGEVSGGQGAGVVLSV